MKHFFVLFVMLMPLFVFSQQQTDTIPKDSGSRINYTDYPVWLEWKKIDSVWMEAEYHQILNRFKLHMNCAHCESVRLNVDMVIDGQGKLSTYRVTDSNKCGDKFDKKLEDAFMQYFWHIIFPAIFRNHTFSVQLGTGLKC